MLTLILIIAVCVWAWNKYKKTPTMYPGFFSRNRWVTWNLVVQVAVSIFIAYAASQIQSKGTDFLMGDWIGNIIGLLGFSDLSDLYGMARESGMFDASERMNTIATLTSPLIMATMVSGICAFVVLIIALYTVINLKQKKFDANRYFILSAIGAAAIVLSVYLVNAKAWEFQTELFGGDPGSITVGSLIEIIGTAVILGFFLFKYKKNLTEIFDESDEEVGQMPTEEATKRCPFCGEEILAVAKKCKHCGEWFYMEDAVAPTIEIRYIQCPICGEDIEEGTEICPHCDEPVKGKQRLEEKESEKEPEVSTYHQPVEMQSYDFADDEPEEKNRRLWWILAGVVLVIAAIFFFKGHSSSAAQAEDDDTSAAGDVVVVEIADDADE